MQHVATPDSYATVVAVSCFISYIVAGVTGGSAPDTSYPTGVSMLYLLLFAPSTGKKTAQNKKMTCCPY